MASRQDAIPRFLPYEFGADGCGRLRGAAFRAEARAGTRVSRRASGSREVSDAGDGTMVLVGMTVRSGPPMRVPLRSLVCEARLLAAVAGLLPLIARAGDGFDCADVRPSMAAVLREMVHPCETADIAARIERCVEAGLAVQEADALARLRLGYAKRRQGLEKICSELVSRLRWDGAERGGLLLPLFLDALERSLASCSVRAMSRAVCEMAALFSAETDGPGSVPLPSGDGPAAVPLPLLDVRLRAALRTLAAQVRVLRTPRESIAQFIAHAVHGLPDRSLGTLAVAAAQADGTMRIAFSAETFPRAAPDDDGLARYLPKLLFLVAADTIRDRLRNHVMTVAGAMRAEIEAGGDADAALRLAWGRCRHAMEQMQTRVIVAAGVSLPDTLAAMSNHELGCFRALTASLDLPDGKTRNSAWREAYACRIADSDEAMQAGAQRLLQLLRLRGVGVDALLRALRDLVDIVHARNMRSESMGLLDVDIWSDEATRAQADAILARATARTAWDHAITVLTGPAAPLVMRALRAAHGGMARGQRRETAFEWPSTGRAHGWRLRIAIVWLEAVHAALWRRWMLLADVSPWTALQPTQPQLTPSQLIISQSSAPPAWQGCPPDRWSPMLRMALAGEFGVLLPARPALSPVVLGMNVEYAFLHACAVLSARLFETGKRAPRFVRHAIHAGGGPGGAGRTLLVCRDFLADALERVCLSFGIGGVNAQGLAVRAGLSPWAGVEGGRDIAVRQVLRALLLLAGPRDARRLTALLNRVLVQPVRCVLAMMGRDAPICVGDERAYLPRDSGSQIHVDVTRLPDGAYRFDVAVCFEQLRCVEVDEPRGGRRRIPLDPRVSRVCASYAVQAAPGFSRFSYLIGSAGFRYRLIAREPASAVAPR
ncbi:hypothetical protein [Achromobacter aloeverae]